MRVEAGADPFVAPVHLLRRVAEELGGCRAMLERIEAHMQDGSVSAPIAAEIKRWDLQEIDLLGQTLADLARCLHAAALTRSICDASGMNGIAVLADLHLDDLRYRLAVGQPRAVADAEIEIEIEIF